MALAARSATRPTQATVAEARRTAGELVASARQEAAAARAEAEERTRRLLADARETPVETSLQLLESLHDRWVRLLRSMSPTDFSRNLMHPESGVMSLDNVLALYGWHGRHHTAHITSLRQRMGW